MKFPLTNLNLYKSFLAAYEARSMSRAAEVLGTTQPNITHNIKELERQINTKLFFSSPRGVRPTKEADSLYPQISAAFGSIVSVENSIRDFSDQSFGCVRVACPSHFTSSVLLDFLKQFCEKYKNISLDLYSESAEEMVDMLKKQKIDVLIIPSKTVQGMEGSYQITDLLKLEYEFFASKSFLEKHGLDTTLTLEQVRTLPFVVHKTSPRYQEFVSQHNLTSERMIYTPIAELSYKFVQEGLCIGSLLKEFQESMGGKSSVVPVQVKGLKPNTRTLACVYDKTITDKVALAFIKELENFCKTKTHK